MPSPQQVQITDNIPLLPRLDASRGSSYDRPARELLRDITSNWGKLQYAEILRPNALVKPFFDCELYLTSQPTETELHGILESQATAIGKQI